VNFGQLKDLYNSGGVYIYIPLELLLSGSSSS
jgi:hypothetical protein